MLLEIDALPLVEMDFMNEVHKADIEIINRLFTSLLAYEKEASEEKTFLVDRIFEEWYRHTVDHFEGEEAMMRERAFPAYAMHKGEHDRVLMHMQALQEAWKNTREVKPLKIYLIEELPLWLNNHISTMDTVTARFFKMGISPCAI